MRGLSLYNRRDEHGAVVVLMVVISVVMVGMAALVIDVGSIHDEKRQLQNGADAGAIAVAHSCALGACDPSLADGLADENARDEATTVKSVTVTGNSVEVVTETLSAGDTDILPFSFGRTAAGDRGDTFTAKATATWGPAGRATAVRLPISECDMNRLSGSIVESTITFHDPRSPCAPAGHDAPGNFGWLADDGDPCVRTLWAGDTPTGATGRTAEPADCLALQMNSEILLPVATASGQGANATYTIKGFARFHLTGYRFRNKTEGQPVPCPSSVDCIRGYFTQYVEASGVIGGTDFGVSTVRLIK